MIGLDVTTVHVLYKWVLQYGCCQTAQDLTTACIGHVQLYRYCTFHFPKFYSAQRSTPSVSHISLWSTRIARRQSENSAAAQPLIGIRSHTPKQSSVKLWQTKTALK